MSIDVDDIAPPAGNAWKPDIGDTAKGTITYAAKSVRDSFDGSKREESLRIDLVDDDGETVSIYCTTNTDVDGGGWAKRDAKAVSAAVRSAGAKTLELGGTLAMKRIDDAQTDRGAAKAFQAQYKPPAPGATVEADDAADGAVDDLL